MRALSETQGVSAHRQIRGVKTDMPATEGDTMLYIYSMYTLKKSGYLLFYLSP